MNNSSVVLKIEIENLRTVVATALSGRQADVSAQVNKAINQFLEDAEGNIERIIKEEVHRACSAILAEEARFMFTQGEPSKAIRAEIRHALSEMAKQHVNVNTKE